MAVKQKVVECVPQTAEARIQILLRTLQDITAQQGLGETVCAQIVISLGTVQIPTDSRNYMQFITDIKSIQEILAKECTKTELKYVTLKTLYKEISHPNKQLSPAMSIVLQLIDVGQIPSAVNLILQAGYSDQSLERALFTLCNWLTKWTCTENLGPLIYQFMQVLMMRHSDIVLDVTMSCIEQLFKLLIVPEPRKSVGCIVLYMLSRVQTNTPEIFHRIVPHVARVVRSLDKEKSETSLHYLQNIVNLCIVLMERYPSYSMINEALKNDLEPYISESNYKQITNWKPWLIGDDAATIIRSSIGKVGLNNLGNTCYMNSVLQALFMTKPFRNEVLLNNRAMMPLFSKLQVLFALLQHSQKGSLSPNGILNLARPPGFLPGHQHDSSEFLGYLLDVLHEQEKSVLGGSGEVDAAGAAENASVPVPNTIVQTAFGGRTVSVSTCGKCGRENDRVDNFRELQLSFPNNSDNQSVQTLLDYYVQPEQLSGDNQYHCDVCCCLTDGQRVTFIEEAPPRLILTLKHFRYDPASQQRTKLLQRVKLDSYVHLVGAEYELYAAVVHWGNSVDSGHYYTFAKDGNEWFKFNDCSVMKTTSDELYSLKPPETPYILFYAKQNCADPENLPETVLSQRLQLAVSKDNSESDLEKRRPIKTYNTRQNRNDEPPPPGCGGGGFSNSSSNMYVC